jgi:hypothetical protein
MLIFYEDGDSVWPRGFNNILDAPESGWLDH